MRLEFVVPAEEAGTTLAAALRRRLLDCSWSRARGLCARGKVSVGGAPAPDASRRLAAGDAILLDEHARDPAPPPVRIVFEDSQLVVIDKPAGISSVPYERREVGTAMDRLRATWRAAGRHATRTPLFVVHRLDKDSSGLLLYAKTKRAETALQAQFRAHTAGRTYLCVAHGRVAAARLESRLLADRGDGLRGSRRGPGRGGRGATAARGPGKLAVTHVTPLRTLRGATLCEVRLETGRTHQIRIHLAEAGHPLVGERVYLRDFLRAGRAPLPATRLLLHAARLGFTHPLTAAPVDLEAPLPDDFAAAVAALAARATSKERGEPRR